jgi:VanZ family protein
MDAGLKRALTVLAWLILAVIVCSTLSPIGMRPHLGAAHVERFAAFALLGFLFTTLHPGRIVAVLLCLAAAVAGLELLQMLVSGRHARVADVAVKAAGGVCGVASAWLVMRLRALAARPGRRR